MAVQEIVTLGHPVLTRRAQEVLRITKKTTRLIKDLLETMYEANGVGLAAPQIGVGKRVIVLDVGEGPMVLINPEITEKSGEEIDVEGCLSIPERWVYVKRYTELQVEALNEKGNKTRIEANGLLARALQHEIDHLDGVLILDRMIEEAVVETKEDGE